MPTTWGEQAAIERLRRTLDDGMRRQEEVGQFLDEHSKAAAAQWHRNAAWDRRITQTSGGAP